ncbi:type VII secretion-associated serine protease mycosin [Actinokineospora sp. HUAS TT18]|uniref:type VII secretion-associated serine protease mycosin n=1 Tax=Actinokineospora sp. HUAS TT18 TaxID=3447451 RepID=UPI003F526909
MRRLPAVVAAATLITLAAAPLAVAQQPTEAEKPSMATPPPLPPGFPVPSGTAPDIEYKRSVECISSLNQGVDLKNKPWGQLQLRFDELHKFATGKNVLVGVIDTGVKQHPYFQDRLSGGGDFVVAANNGLEDCDGHGTEVAGIIAAKTPADIGFKGIAPDARILSIRQSSQNYKGKRVTPTDPNPGETPAGTIDTLAQAVVHAANQNVKVLNMSVDSCRFASEGAISRSEQNLQAALKYAFDKDVVIVASAGNSGAPKCQDAKNGSDPNRPTSIVLPPWFAEHVISVAAMTRTGDIADFSIQGPWVTVAAPGTEIISLDPATDGLANMQVLPSGQRSAIQGTSFAAPYVAGLAALIREKFPTLNAKQVMERIKITSAHPAATGGRDNLVGYGMINPISALTSIIPAEQGTAPDDALDVKIDLPPPVVKDWTPMRVAVIGSGAGLLALLATLLVVHTVRRNRRGGLEPRGSA